MIPRRNLSLLSNRLARNGSRRIPEAVLERDYCLSWFLVGLSRTPLADNLAFKGGTAIKKCYVPEYRFSEDLDFTRSVVQIYPPLPDHSKGYRLGRVTPFLLVSIEVPTVQVMILSLRPLILIGC